MKLYVENQKAEVRATTSGSVNRLQKSNRWRLRVGERRTLLVIGDLVAGSLSLVVALYIWASGDAWLSEVSLEFLKSRPPTWFYLLPLIWLILLVETYDLRNAGDLPRTVRGVFLAAAIGLMLYLGIYFYSTPKSLPRRGVASFILAVTATTFFWRYLYIRVISGFQFLRRVLVVGAGRAGSTLLEVINETSPEPFVIIGIVDDDPEKIGQTIERYAVLGGSECLTETITREKISELIVAISGEMGGKMFQALLDAQELGVEITRMPVVYEELLGRVPIHHLEADWIIRSFVDEARVSAFYRLGKRLVDIAGGLMGALLLIVLLPFIALATLIDSGLPLFYVQTRSGQGGHPYQMIKFRTMRKDAEADGQPRWAKENDERATRVGRFLRRTHLDELPQFLNVLRGEMSLVGPRAERPELVELFQHHVPFYRSRLLVKPGITGWAQIHYGYAVTVEDTAIKLEYDLYYIKHRSLLLDFVIVLRTVGAVAGFRGR